MHLLRRITHILVICAAALTPSAVLVANPYCVAGYGVLSGLGMPAASTDYDWNGLHTDRAIQMCRPNHYYNYIGIPVRWWGYNEVTGEINDPVQFAAWVTANPGKTWVIGNEPDLYSQDGLTIDQYVHMFRTYHSFITPLDATAKFAIAGITGGSTAERLTHTINWFTEALNKYRAAYGTAMPVDVWNVHSYCGPTQIDDPDRIISEFVNPFVNWCHSVENGAYAGCEVWITELPIGEWMGAVSPENTIRFMQHYMPRLEQTGVTKWFWFVSRDSNEFAAVALVSNNVPTAIGQAYAALANSYPNPVPPVVPFVPDPAPAYAFFDFSEPLASPWFNKGGNWGVDSGALRHTGFYPWSGVSCCLLYSYQDVGVSFRMKINSAEQPANWAGVALRTADRMHAVANSGYLFLVRRNGEAVLYNQTSGAMVSVPGAVADVDNYHDYRITIEGFRIRVWIDGVLRIDSTDSWQRFASGYVTAQVHKADASFDDMHVVKFPVPTPVVTDDGGFTTDLSRLRASWTVSDTANIQGYLFAVGTSPGATDVMPWTHTSDTSIDLQIVLTQGSSYYVQVKSVYPGGLESSAGSSDGIAAAIAVPTLRETKSIPLSTMVVVENKMVSGVFPDCVYAQEPDRSGGIRVQGSFAVDAGDVVTILGRTALAGKELCLTNASIVSRAPGAAPGPLGVTNASAGGGTDGEQPSQINDALTGATAAGVSPVGLLVRTSGRVSFVDPLGLFAYVDDGSGIRDGSGHTGVRVSLTGLPEPVTGAFARVTGCCSVIEISGACARFLKPRSEDDVWFSEIAVKLANGGFETGSIAPWTVEGTGWSIPGGTWYMSISAHSGSRFFGVYGNYSIHSGVVRQTINVPQGAYRASVWSRVLHGANDEHAARSRIGIDPAGGIDPDAASVLWSDWDSQPAWYYSEWRELHTPDISSPGGPVTVFLHYVQEDPVGWHINCFDDASITSL